MKYAGVIVDISGGKLDRAFTYRVPETLSGQLAVGMQVEVPFGPANRRINAWVVELSDRCAYDDSQVKELFGIREKGVAVEGQLIRLAGWMREEYGSSMLQALKTVLPVRRSVAPVRRREVVWQLSQEERPAFLAGLSPKRNAAQLRLLTELSKEGRIPYETVTARLHVSAATLRSLTQKGVIRIEEENLYRNPVKLTPGPAAAAVLNEEQRCIADTIWEEARQGVGGTYLIHGVTGSGKTEVYMELIAHMLEAGRQTIVLIPEIALTYQTVMRFYRRFGDQVSILNSRMSAGERYDQFIRAKKGEIRVMVGPRSALFTPFTHLGLIIIDEEHETSYKSETSPRYHAIGVARRRAAMAGARLHNAYVGTEHLLIAIGDALGGVLLSVPDRGIPPLYAEAAGRPGGGAAAGGAYRPARGAGGGEPFDSQPASGRADGGAAEKGRADDFISEPERLFRFYLLPFVRQGDSVSPLRCVIDAASRRPSGLPLLRL